MTTGDSKVMVPDAALRFARPKIRAGGSSFQWPVGPEGFRRYGNATLAVHHYFGGTDVDVNVLHYNEGHIDLNGTFSGITSPSYMVRLEKVLTSRLDKSLFVPGVFPAEEPVVVDNYDFSHDKDDRTHSIDYSITLTRTGAGTGSSSGGSQSVANQVANQIASAPQTAQRDISSQSQRTFIAAAGADTFRSIASIVYGNADKWTSLVDLNQDVIQANNPDKDIMFKYGYQMAYQKLPIGTRVRY